MKELKEKNNVKNESVQVFFLFFVNICIVVEDPLSRWRRVPIIKRGGLGPH
jgi:hypothetical protein